MMIPYKQLREARIAAGLTQREVAERMHSHRADVGNLENGKTNPTVEYLTRYCEAVGIKLEYFVKTLENTTSEL